MKFALEIIREKTDIEEEVSPYDALKASFDIFFRGILSNDMFSFYGELCKFFNFKN